MTPPTCSASCTEERSEELLDLMEPEEAEDVRALLKYGPDTAGGLMTSEPIVLSADATVAEALALIRRHELHPALAAAVFVTLPPFETPTGRLLGTVHFQRMLRYPPHERLGAIIDDTLDPVPATASAAEVARMLASYNLVSLPVVDQARRLVGAVSVDDVLDYLLPDDWRSHDERRRAVPERVPDDDRERSRGGADGAAVAPGVARRAPRARRDAAAHAAALERPLRPVLGGVRARDGHVGIPDRHDDLRRRVARVEHLRAAASCSSTRASTNFTLLTLILSLQASYAAPLILLAQNRQDDRDRVQIEQDRQRAERNLADTEYLAREIVALRMALTDVSDEVVTRDVLRTELRVALERLDARTGGRRTAQPMTTGAADAVRRAVGAVVDPELRRPIGELDMVRDISVDGRRRPRRHRPDDRRLPCRRPHLTRGARGRGIRRGNRGCRARGRRHVAGRAPRAHRAAARRPRRARDAVRTRHAHPRHRRHERQGRRRQVDRHREPRRRARRARASPSDSSTPTCTASRSRRCSASSTPTAACRSRRASTT